MIHRPPPPLPPASVTAVEIPAPVAVAPGRIGWPRIFRYEWKMNGCTLRATLPPAGQGIGYRVIVKDGQQAVYDALVATGAVRDPRHTGRARSDAEAPTA